MTVENALRDLFRAEVENQLRPLREAVARIERNQAAVGSLLSPAAALLGVNLAIEPAPSALAPVRRGPGRPPGKPGTGKRGPGRPPKSAAAGAAGGAPTDLSNDRACALRGCGEPARTRGYCSKHYQKLRLLERTGRRPPEWVDFAAPRSVDNVVLPRGRAAKKAVKAT